MSGSVFYSQDQIISLRGEVWPIKRVRSHHFSIRVPVLSQESEPSCICVNCMDFVPVSMILGLDMWNCSGLIIRFFSQMIITVVSRYSQLSFLLWYTGKSLFKL